MRDDKALRRSLEYQKRQEALEDGPLWNMEKEALPEQEKIRNDSPAAEPEDWNSGPEDQA